jgi:hypothetical protein
VKERDVSDCAETESEDAAAEQDPLVVVELHAHW